MAEVTVTLQDIETFEGISKKNNKPYTRFTVKASDGRKYQTFRREVVEPGAALKGQLVVISYDESQNGDYTNYDLTGIRAVPTANSLSQPTGDTLGAQGQEQGPLVQFVPENVRSAYTASDKDTSIARAVAFKGAVELAANGAIEIAKPESILDIADTFVPWLLNTTATASPPTEENPFADLSEEPVDAKGELVKF